MTRPTAITPRGATTINLPAPGIPYYTPVQNPPAGTVLETDQKDTAVPTLFTPLKIRGVELTNRFVVSPMCTYSADDGHLTDFHLVHVGQFALRGAALTIVEATSVLPNGRISPEDSGLWQDSQIEPLRRIADFVHGQGHKIGIQLGHAGRKASTLPLWLDAKRGEHENVLAEEGGWPANTWSASAEPYAPDWAEPLAITVAQIDELVAAFAAAAKRAVAAGIDVIEVHGAHGYCMTQFLSPQTNKRTDDYGGSFANRTRLLTRVLQAVRGAVPDTMPVFLRLSATEWMETLVAPGESWTLADTIRLAKLLPGLGVDVLDISSGGNMRQQKIEYHPFFQIDLATQVRQALQDDPATASLLIAAVGMVDSAEMARDVVQKGGKYEADLVLVARNFLREPEFVLRAAHQLGVAVQWPNQYRRAQWPEGAKI